MNSKLARFSGLLILTSVASCSSLVESTRKSLLNDESPRKTNSQEVKWVSRAQYDDLMSKYKELNEKYENLRTDSLQQNSPISKMNALAANQQPSETIDVFGQNGIAKPKIAMEDKSIDESQADKEIQLFKKAVLLKNAGKGEQSLEIFQFLEKSQIKQIQVRSKRHIGEVYFQKKQYDLSLQVFESIIRQDSYSGSVILALEYAAKCAGMLGLQEKKLQYQSILKDFFGVKA